MAVGPPPPPPARLFSSTPSNDDMIAFLNREASNLEAEANIIKQHALTLRNKAKSLRKGG